jgi:hypothetical protein
MAYSFLHPGDLARVVLLAGATALLAGCMTTSSNPPVAAVNQASDGSLSCPQISAQISEMNERLGIAEGEMRSAQAMGLAQDVAINAALYSGALGSAASSVPFLGSALSFAGQIGQMSEEQKRVEAERAMNRRNVLTGMYAAKGCGAPQTLETQAVAN